MLGETKCVRSYWKVKEIFGPGYQKTTRGKVDNRKISRRDISLYFSYTIKEALFLLYAWYLHFLGSSTLTVLVFLFWKLKFLLIYPSNTPISHSTPKKHMKMWPWATLLKIITGRKPAVENFHRSETSPLVQATNVGETVTFPGAAIPNLTQGCSSLLDSLSLSTLIITELKQPLQSQPKSTPARSLSQQAQYCFKEQYWPNHWLCWPRGVHQISCFPYASPCWWKSAWALSYLARVLLLPWSGSTLTSVPPLERGAAHPRQRCVDDDDDDDDVWQWQCQSTDARHSQC